MPSDSEVRTRILNKAREHFFRSGFTKVTTDEIAAELGMSKKTLYKFFPSKEKLLRGAVETHLKETEVGIQRVLRDGRIDFVEKLKRLMKFIGEQLSRLGKPFIHDVRRNAPEVWREVDEFRRTRILSEFGKLFKQGAQKGVFRSDFDLQLILMMYTSAVQEMVNPEVLSQLPNSAAEVVDTIIKVIFEGMLTDEARASYFQSPRSFQE